MTTLTKKVNGVEIELTAEEQAAIEAEWAANEVKAAEKAVVQAEIDASLAIDEQIKNATITTSAGNTFKCDKESRSDLLGVISLAQFNGSTEAEFKFLNSSGEKSFAFLAMAELIEAGTKIEAKIKQIMKGE